MLYFLLFFRFDMDRVDIFDNEQVVDESTTNSAPNELRSKANIVKAEWFWSSVQNEACVNEKDHQFQEVINNKRLKIILLHEVS